MAALFRSCRRIGRNVLSQCATRSFTKVTPSPDNLILTESCVKQIRKVCSDGSSGGAGSAEALRLTVDGGGCSGFQYKFSIDALPESLQSPSSEDLLIVDPSSGARVLIDQQSLDFVRGATVDYQAELIRSSFRVVRNPKAEQGCSCGVSFALKSAAAGGGSSAT